jgi:nitrate reductase NapE component
VLTSESRGRISAAGRIVVMAAIAGLLFAALALPAVGGFGFLTRGAADKWNILAGQ